ncbi:MAG TPA: hypothetical protein DCX90_06115 [Ruminococcaceae bacterium]|nr:hypothetical protein [Oscillospiraceae bacterium]
MMFSLDMDLSYIVFPFLLAIIVVITICICKLKLLYLGLNAGVFFLLYKTISISYVPWTWLCFAISFVFLLGSLPENESTWLRKWKKYVVFVSVADFIFGNIYDDFFIKSMYFLILWFAVNMAAYIGLYCALAINDEQKKTQ